MAHTKRKRRTKHRGNAAGHIEARGRTGRKPRPDERKGGSASAARAVKPPTWRSAFFKAAFGAVFLFVMVRFGLLGKGQSTGQALSLAAFAAAAYTPIMYVTDRFLYRRKLAQQRRPPGS